MNSESILLSTHENPDCDGLGSEIALYYYIKSLGKDCKIINSTVMSNKYKFIDPDNIIEVYNSSQDKWLMNIDLAIVLDIGSHERLNEISILTKNCRDKISIDHHISKDNDFFSFELVDLKAPATGTIVWDFLDYLDVKPLTDIKISNALYAAIITDTGSFRYSNTNPKTHIIASSLLENGVDPNEIYQNVYENRSKPQIALLAHVINNIQYAIDGEVAFVLLTREDFEKCGANLFENDGMSDFLRGIEGVEVSFVVTEIKIGLYKISIRSRKKYIINDIAAKFGGGGHALAAGATIQTDNVKELIDKIIYYLEKRIK
jgi:phosphoesterase RecJ-like protein